MVSSKPVACRSKRTATAISTLHRWPACWIATCFFLFQGWPTHDASSSTSTTHVTAFQPATLSNPRRTTTIGGSSSASLPRMAFVAASTLHTAMAIPDGPSRKSSVLSASLQEGDTAVTSIGSSDNTEALWEDFVQLVLTQQEEIIETLEQLERDYGSNATFSRDAWGTFATDDSDRPPAGGLTRVIQGGAIVAKGACSSTILSRGILSAERAASLRSRAALAADGDGAPSIQAGDTYRAAALSMVLHSQSPHVPTFRSDIRVFCVGNAETGSFRAWVGGGADLTPYYLEPSDISDFHECYQELCDKTAWSTPELAETFGYAQLKENCDDYFYLPARGEHRGTGGIFWDDMPLTSISADFARQVATAWMPSWIPIVRRRQDTPVSQREEHWQQLRRGRYLEFNLLYDRGVKFGLAQQPPKSGEGKPPPNSRIEAIMVSAPPIIAFDYQFPIEAGSPEEEIMEVLREPKSWVRNK